MCARQEQPPSTEDGDVLLDTTFWRHQRHALDRLYQSGGMTVTVLRQKKKSPCGDRPEERRMLAVE